MHCPTAPRRTLRSLCLGTLAGAATLLAAGPASATAPCDVTEADDDINLPGSLRYCVDQVNQGVTSEIVIQAFQWYAPDSPLVFEKSAHVSGYGRIVVPGDQFVGDSLFVIGTQCPGPSCQGPVEVELEGLELGAMGFAGVRGIEVLAGHSLILENAQMYEFSVPAGNGGCIWADGGSELTISGSTLEGCTALDGGAVFSEASATSISGSAFNLNAAGYNGGAIAIGTAGFSLRSLSVANSTFDFNSGNWGGAIKASGGVIMVEVVESEFTGNGASARGGAIYGGGTFDRCVFTENSAKNWGGGLYLVEDAIVLDSMLLGNEARVGGGLNFSPGGSANLNFDGSTVAYNVVKGDAANGAGMIVLGGEVHVLNSTFSENIANDSVQATAGGGLAVMGGKVGVEHATFGDNVATEGGGIYVDGAGTLFLNSSIVAYSSGDDCTVYGGLVQLTSLDTDGTCNADFSGLDPSLDTLTDNGGPTWTRWPHASEVLDVAACFAAEDQRDEPRPESDCDIGAVEQ